MAGPGGPIISHLHPCLLLQVALDLWQALVASPQAQWLEYLAQTSGGLGGGGINKSYAAEVLRTELQQQAALVWRFIIDREIEAPDRFQVGEEGGARVALHPRQGD